MNEIPLQEYLEAAILVDMWRDASRNDKDIWLSSEFKWDTTGEMLDYKKLVDENEIEITLSSLERKGYVEGIYDSHARTRWKITESGHKFIGNTQEDRQSLISKYRLLGIEWIREVLENFQKDEAPDTQEKETEVEAQSIFDPVDDGEVARDSNGAPVTEDDGVPIIATEKPNESGKWDEAEWDKAKWADDPDSWKKPDAVGELSPEAVEQIKSLIDQAIKDLPHAKLSNEDQSQAMARLEAAKTLANAPTPPWGKVREILEPLVPIATITGAIAAILALII